MAVGSIKSDNVLTIDGSLRVRLHAMTGGAVALGIDQSNPVFSCSFHMDSNEARELAKALMQYADLSEQPEAA